MSLAIKLVHTSSFNSFIKKYPQLSVLKEGFLTNLYTKEEFQYQRNNECVSYINVTVIGKTGYGKSTLLNTLVGDTVFYADDIASCTKELFCADYIINPGEIYKFYFGLNDTPGIGESEIADKKYLMWYKKLIDISGCTLYLLRADMRDYALDLSLFNEFFPNNKRGNVVIGVNCVEKIEPINRTKNKVFSLSYEQIRNLEKKKIEIEKLFKIPRERIIELSALENYNTNNLLNEVAKVIVKNPLYKT